MSLLFCNQNKAQSQLRISGLFSSAYWFGQALVDVPMYFLILLLMYLLDYGLNFQESAFVTINPTIQVSDDIHRTNTVEWFHEKNWRCKWYLYCYKLNRCKTLCYSSLLAPDVFLRLHLPLTKRRIPVDFRSSVLLAMPSHLSSWHTWFRSFFARGGKIVAFGLFPSLL